MRLLVVGSDSIHVSSYITALNKKGITPYFLSETACVFNDVVENKIINFRSLKPSLLLKNNKGLKQYLIELKPNVVHIHQVNRLAYFVSRICDELKIPIITTAWGSDVLLIPQKNSFYKFLVKKVLLRSRFVTADSINMIESMKKNITVTNDKFVLLQYGVDIISPVEKQNVIYSNRLHKALYRIDQIIAYFHQFISTNPNWKLIIAGSGDMTEDLVQQVEELKLGAHVKFVGWLSKEENNAWYAKSKIYISIPESDGTAVSLLEAMSAGCIPIVPNLDVSREWVRDGVNGVIETSSANPINKALEIDIDDCYKINRKLIEEKSDRSTCTQQFINLYNLSIGN